MMISKRAQKLTPSATLAMAAKARKLSASGINIISFATGEPDFDTPVVIKNTAKEGLNEGLTKYMPAQGTYELRKSICAKLKRDNNLTYNEDEIVVTCGAKQAIYNALQVIINNGDEVIIPSPYWVSFPDHVLLAEGIPVIAKTEPFTGFKLTPDILRKHMTQKTRTIILNTPSNPTGSAYSHQELNDLGKILVENKIAIISDEIYEKLVYENFTHTSIATAYPPAKDYTIIINGVSKAYAMTGWRMGYAAGPKDVISKITELVGQQTTSIPGFIQKACKMCLDNSEDEIKKMRDEFEKRRDLMLTLMLGVPKIKCHKPDGAFYLFPNVEAYLGGKIKTTLELSEYLLDEAHIATVSGEPFGAPGYIRFSYATSRENIEEGMRRLKEALSKI